MKNIESYNSSYPLAYYEVGTVYSFYGQVSAKGTPASAEAIQKYSSVLSALDVEEQENAIKPVNGSTASPSTFGGKNRFYAVVIEKVKSDSNVYIVVMLCNKHNGCTEYYTRKYSVNLGCMTDGKDLMPVSTHLDFEANNSYKIGGITKSGKSEKIGGITKANGNNSSTSSVGGITKAHHSNKPADTTIANGKAGGVTLAKEHKIGGITKANK